MSVETAIEKLAKTLYGEDPAVVARAIHNTFPDTKIYLAVHCGRSHMSGTAAQFCRICAAPITGDLYEAQAANSEKGNAESTEQGDAAAAQRPHLNEERADG